MASGGSGTYSQWQHCVWRQLGKQEARQGTAWPDLRSEDHFESEASLNCSVKPCLRKKSVVWWLIKNGPHRFIDLNVWSPGNGLDGGVAINLAPPTSTLGSFVCVCVLVFQDRVSL